MQREFDYEHKARLRELSGAVSFFALRIFPCPVIYDCGRHKINMAV